VLVQQNIRGSPVLGVWVITVSIILIALWLWCDYQKTKMAIKLLHTAHTPTSLRHLTNSQVLKKRTLTTNLQLKTNGLCRLEVVHMLSKSYAFVLQCYCPCFRRKCLLEIFYNGCWVKTVSLWDDMFTLRTKDIQACAQIFCNLFIRDIIVHWVEALWVQKWHHVADSS